MRFHQPVGVIPPNNDFISINYSGTNNQLTRLNPRNNGAKLLNRTEIKTTSTAKRSENINNLNPDRSTTLEDILKLKPDSKYFKDYFGSRQTDTSNVDLSNGNDGTFFIESLNFCEANLTEFVTSSPTTPYDNCVTNQSFNEQNCWQSIQRQRRENLIKLDLESNYMTRHERPMQVGDNSAGCSVESSPVDSLLDDQDLLSPSPSSCADLSSPDPNELQRRYPRGIINPNYPGFQHLAHTLAEHFIDHHHHQFEPSSDSEISDDFDFDVAYRGGNLASVNIMNDINDSNNNNDNINNNGARLDKNIDLNQNKNRRSSFSALERVANVAHMVTSKEYEDGNVNLLMKAETKVFCENKQLGLHETADIERFSSEDEDEECCNVSTNAGSSDSNRMDFDDDELADLSGEDDAAIKNELENIDKADNEFVEHIDCDLATYLQQYDYKMDVKKSYKREEEEECLTDEDNSKLPTPDILIEHNSSEVSKKLQNEERNELGREECSVGISASDEMRDYQPDLIKSITDTINTSDNNRGMRVENAWESGEGDNEVSPPVEHEIPDKAKATDDDDEEKIINQAQTEPAENIVAIHRNLPLSLESTSSATVDIIGDFGKEIEKEIGLIVSGYRMAARPTPTDDIFDEHKFIEHLKCFSKMGDAALSNAEESIVVKTPTADASDRHEHELSVSDLVSLIPTAIVKPKYQKLSFDERQLPACGSTVDNSWQSPTNTASTTITSTPRKVQKHLPKSQKSFVKQQTRKVVNKSGEFCVDYDVSDKEAISALRHTENDIDCGVIQNSIAIVQPLKKNIDASVNANDEKNQKADSSKNSLAMSHKHEQNIRNSSKVIATNELASVMSECDKNNLSGATRKTVSSVCDVKKAPVKKREQRDYTDAFDVYNIETALPVIDLEAIETHLMAAKEEEQKRKNDREAIRRRLAMGEEDDYFTNLTASRPVRKPNLQSRLQNGKNLQICFMNEAASDSESSDSETCPKLSQGMTRKKNIQRPSSLMKHRTASLNNNPYNSRPLSVVKSVMAPIEKAERPATLSLGPPSDPSDNNFFTQQARLQIEARMALSQAKDMAHMQMEIERQKQGMCPITELVHRTLDKVGMRVSPTKRRLSRQMLTNMNIAQLQIIINEFHTFIETLNELLVKYLMDRDDLSMRQDSMLIDIEDITRYLAEKEEAQLSAVSSPVQPKHIVEPKAAFTKRTAPTAPTTRLNPTFAFSPLQQNKKSMVVNGNGTTVRTSISRDIIERNGLHL